MNCEMCGADVDSLIIVRIEGTEMRVCRKCVKYGVRVSGKGSGPIAQEIVGKEPELEFQESRKRVMGRKKGLRVDLFDKMVYDLAEDYGDQIRNAREAMELTQEELAKRINEKRSIIAKLESGDIRPDEKTTRKLEKILGIDLKEKYEEV